MTLGLRVIKGGGMGTILGTVFGLLLVVVRRSDGAYFGSSRIDTRYAIAALIIGIGLSGMLAGVSAGYARNRATAMVAGVIAALPATIAGSLLTYRPVELIQTGSIVVVALSTIVVGCAGGSVLWTDYQRDRGWWDTF
ncbi:MAG: hypothetical protein ABI442_17360 [Gemmatimonadaceae bacterium]